MAACHRMRSTLPAPSSCIRSPSTIPLKGISADQLRYSVLSPITDISFIEEARKKFIAESAYLDDRPGAPMRFLAEANLRQIIRREERHVDAEEARAELNDPPSIPDIRW